MSERMEHTEATESMAAERYLLGEMTPEDRDAFEEHFFGCPECAAAVREGAAIAAAIRTDAIARPSEIRRRPVTGWLAAAAAILIALAAVPLVQNIRLRSEVETLRAPRLIEGVTFLTGTTRSAQEATTVSASRSFVLAFDVPPQTGARRYVVRVVDDAGKVVATSTVTPEGARDTQQLFVPAGSLSPGRYSLEIHPEPARSPATALPFLVR